jgi:CRP-like cAMP-binding protein
MDLEILLKLLEEKTELSPGFIEALSTKLSMEIYKPHQIIQAAGNIENRVFFVETGFARTYFYDQLGQEHTVRFWEPGNIMFSYEGYYKVASYFYIEVMADSRFISLSYENLYDLEKTFPETKFLIRYFLLQFQKEDFDKQQIVSLPTEERYLYLRKHKNYVFSKVSAKIIASYLHLSRETLSRYMSKKH